MSDRCTGHCCRRFPLSASLEEIREDLARVARGEPHRYGTPRDAAFILDMVVPLERSAVPDGHVGEPRQYYTCRHLLATGDCGVYEQRPLMCSDYPYEGGRCHHPECTWDDGRNPPIPADRLTIRIAGPKLFDVKESA